MKKLLTSLTAIALILGLFAVSTTTKAVVPAWNTSGNYVVQFTYQATNYAHSMTLVQDSGGNLTGNGGYPAGGPYTYTWNIGSGTVSGSNINFTATYTSGLDALTPLTIMNVTGTIGGDGSMSGTWTDNYQGGSRNGTWMTSSGTAISIPDTTNPTNVSIIDPVCGSSVTQAELDKIDWTDSTDDSTPITYIYQSSLSSAKNGDGTFITPAYTSGPLSASEIPTLGTPEGTYYVQVQATDAQNNKSDWSEECKIIVDNTPEPSPTPSPVTVTIVKYLDGQHATAVNSNSTAFPMHAIFPGGSGDYTLSPIGYNNPSPYEATTSEMPYGSNYSTYETLPASCVNGNPYALNGYSVGDSLFSAQNNGNNGSTLQNDASFENLQDDTFVIVWNRTCTSTTTPPSNACSYQTAPAGYTLVNGSSGNDNVTLAPNTMFKGNGGKDNVKGGNGNYIICTGNGKDSIILGNGESFIDAGNGNNNVIVGNGKTTIYTGNDDDTIQIGNGKSYINAGNGKNNINTGNGDKQVITGNDKDNINSGNGNDTINAGDGKNNINSASGNDSITAGNGDDNINGGPGNDTCNAGGGTNIVTNCNP